MSKIVPRSVIAGGVDEDVDAAEGLVGRRRRRRGRRRGRQDRPRRTRCGMPASVRISRATALAALRLAPADDEARRARAPRTAARSPRPEPCVPPVTMAILPRQALRRGHSLMGLLDRVAPARFVRRWNGNSNGRVDRIRILAPIHGRPRVGSPDFGRMRGAQMLRVGLLGAGRIGRIHGGNVAAHPKASWSRSPTPRWRRALAAAEPARMVRDDRWDHCRTAASTRC